MKSNNRREFLKKSFLGISGAALLPSNLKIEMTGGTSISERRNYRPVYWVKQA